MGGPRACHAALGALLASPPPGTSFSVLSLSAPLLALVEIARTHFAYKLRQWSVCALCHLPGPYPGTDRC